MRRLQTYLVFKNMTLCSPQSCVDYCNNGGLCSLTGPGLTAVCTCGHRFRGQFCEELVFWFEFFVKDNKREYNFSEIQTDLLCKREMLYLSNRFKY